MRARQADSSGDAGACSGSATAASAALATSTGVRTVPTADLLGCWRVAKLGMARAWVPESATPMESASSTPDQAVVGKRHMHVIRDARAWARPILSLTQIR